MLTSSTFVFRSSRYWTTEECGIAAIIVFVFYFILGRMSERHIGRSYERELTEASRRPEVKNKYGMLGRMSYFSNGCGISLARYSCNSCYICHLELEEVKRK